MSAAVDLAEAGTSQRAVGESAISQDEPIDLPIEHAQDDLLRKARRRR